MMFYTVRKKAIIWLLSSVMTLGTVRGCALLDLGGWTLDQIQPSSVLNAEALGIVDTGIRNPTLPDYPNYDDDPTCVIPGYCGETPFYPDGTGRAGATQ